MDLFEKQAQLQSLFQTSPVDAAYAQGTTTGRRIAGTYQDLDVALLLLSRVNASEFFDYQVYFVSELSKTLEIEGLDVVILNQASLLQRAQIIRSWSLLYQRDQQRRVPGDRAGPPQARGLPRHPRRARRPRGHRASPRVPARAPRKFEKPARL